MNRVVREKYGGRCWAVVVDNLVVEEYKFSYGSPSGQTKEVRRYFTNERRYLTRAGLASEFAGIDDLYPSEGEADSAAMLLVMTHPDYMGHIEVVNVNDYNR